MSSTNRDDGFDAGGSLRSGAIGGEAGGSVDIAGGPSAGGMASVPSPSDIVIVAAARTPQGKLNGQLSTLTAPQLGAAAISGALAQASIDASQVDAVLIGHVLSAGVGQNAGRQAALAAGIPASAHVASINKVCLSGLTAVIDAARLLKTGDAQLVVAAGMESMSQAPHLLAGSRKGWAYGSVEALDHMAHDGLTDAASGLSMGLLTEQHNTSLGITREAQDAVAARSHQRAAAAVDAGLFDAEIVAVDVPVRRGEPVRVTRDEGIRPSTTAESLAGLRAAFTADGTITAGNASPISDGASAVVLTSRAFADAHGYDVLAVVGAAGQVAGPDASLQSQPSRAIARACEKQGIAASSLDHIEINEAFAAVVVQSQAELGVSDEVVNPHGGAIALGHPIGASGARVVVHAVHELSRRGGGTAAVALCGGGGQGDALILTR